jgi:hypothetical protein
VIDAIITAAEKSFKNLWVNSLLLRMNCYIRSGWS